MANSKKKQTASEETKKQQEKTTTSKNSQSKKKGDLKKNIESNKTTKKEAAAKSSKKKAEENKKMSAKKVETKSEKKTKESVKKVEAENVLSEEKGLEIKQNKEAKKQEIKKENSKKENTRLQTISSLSVSTDEMTRLVKIILVLIVIIVAFYGLTVLITKFKKSSVADRDKTITPAVIQYDEILIGTMLKQPRDEYYVLIQADDDPYQSLTSYYVSSYLKTTGALKIYTSNLNAGLNSYYISETSNIRPENIKDFRVSGVTLIYVKNHKIVEAYEGIEGVSAALKVLVNTNKTFNFN